MDPVILKGRDVRQVGGERRSGGEANQPVVRTLTHDGVVRAIEVACDCGRTVTIELVHDDETSRETGGQQ